METWLGFKLYKQVIGFATGRDDGGDFTGLHLLERDRVVDVDQLWVDVQPLEYDWSGGTCAIAFRTKAYLFTFQVLEGPDLGAGKEIGLSNEEL